LVPDRVVARDPGAVREHVADRDRGVQLVVVELDGRHELPHRLVPVQLALLDEQAGGDGGEELRVGGDGNRRPWRERQLLPVVPEAVAAGEDELVLHHDADPDPGHVPVLHDLLHVGVEVLELLREGRVRRTPGGRGAAGEGEDGEQAGGAGGDRESVSHDALLSTGGDVRRYAEGAGCVKNETAARAILGVVAEPSPPPAYWLTRFMMLRLLGLAYACAFLVAAFQIRPLVGAHGLTPAAPLFNELAQRVGGRWPA